jgi:hypothetical protein
MSIDKHSGYLKNAAVASFNFFDFTKNYCFFSIFSGWLAVGPTLETGVAGLVGADAVSFSFPQ